jgi:hypothetical protein
MSAAELNEYTLDRVKTNMCASKQLLCTAPVAGEDATAIELACGRLRLSNSRDFTSGRKVKCSPLKDLRFAFRVRKAAI